MTDDIDSGRYAERFHRDLTARDGWIIDTFTETMGPLPKGTRAWQVSTNHVHDSWTTGESRTVYARTKLGAWWQSRHQRKGATTATIVRTHDGIDRYEVGVVGPDANPTWFYEWTDDTPT